MTDRDAPHEIDVPDNEWARAWQAHTLGAPDPNRVAREIMARTWRFDYEIYWRNVREYLAGAVLLVVFAGMVATNHSRMLACVGFACVSFVMIYIWWKHRGLHPLDPAADIASYRAALLARYDEQIRLLRSVPYWYLLPLFVPQVVLAVDLWPRMRWFVLFPVLVTLGVFALVGWLNVKLGVAHLRKARENVESTFPVE